MSQETQTKEIVFDEAQLGDLSMVAQQLFCSGALPGEPGYQRVLERPTVQWSGIAMNCAMPLLICGVLFAVALSVMPWSAALAAALGVLFLYMLLRMKRIIITLVRLYQHYAPDAVRNKCRFEPSCSEYMIRAVQKYGVCRGLHKGVDRLCRCNIKNGGYDEP